LRLLFHVPGIGKESHVRISVKIPRSPRFSVVKIFPKILLQKAREHRAPYFMCLKLAKELMYAFLFKTPRSLANPEDQGELRGTREHCASVV